MKMFYQSKVQSVPVPCTDQSSSTDSHSKIKEFSLNSLLGSYHGLWLPNKAFFHRNSKHLGLGRQFGQINFEAFGVFLANLSAPILVQCSRVLCPCFPLINHYFYKDLGLLFQKIPNIYFRLGFKSGLRRIRDLTIEYPQSVIITILAAWFYYFIFFILLADHNNA